MWIKRIIPKRYYTSVRKVYDTVRCFGFRFKCPCCGKRSGKFPPYGVEPRANAQCDKCGSLERHRLLWLYLRDRTNFFTEQLKVFHLAPVFILQNKFKNLNNIDYISADISSPTAMLTIDITDSPFPDNQFDCIICYHVLEHIPEDEKAMKELFRILRPGGWAILQSPIDYSRDKTFENPNVISPQEREQVFGQKDHVRIYGRDYKERLQKAGFNVKLDGYIQELDDKNIKKYRLVKGKIIYFCTKPKTRNEDGEAPPPPDQGIALLK